MTVYLPATVFNEVWVPPSGHPEGDHYSSIDTVPTDMPPYNLGPTAYISSERYLYKE